MAWSPARQARAAKRPDELSCPNPDLYLSLPFRAYDTLESGAAIRVCRARNLYRYINVLGLTLGGGSRICGKFSAARAVWRTLVGRTSAILLFAFLAPLVGCSDESGRSSSGGGGDTESTTVYISGDGDSEHHFAASGFVGGCHCDCTRENRLVKMCGDKRLVLSPRPFVSLDACLTSSLYQSLACR